MGIENGKKVAMGNNGAKDSSAQGDLVKLHSWEIGRVNNGLDETKVVEIIKELVSERDTLIERTEHLSSLTRLAEQTITSADKLAKQIETEANQRAEAKAANVLAEAEEQAQKLKNETKRIQLELKNAVDELCKQLISEPESFTQRIKNIHAESDNRFSDLVDNTGPANTEEHMIHNDSPDSPDIEDEPRERLNSEKDASTNTESHKVHSDPSIPPLGRDMGWH
ncbi:ATP synthase F0 subunit B [Chloroflexota bacterium]